MNLYGGGGTCGYYEFTLVNAIVFLVFLVIKIKLKVVPGVGAYNSQLEQSIAQKRAVSRTESDTQSSNGSFHRTSSVRT